MKTLSRSIIAVLMILAGISLGFSVPADKSIRIATTSDGVRNTGIKYQVNINTSANKAPVCGTYYVLISDENGALVAPAQKYILGVNSYIFFETRREASGKRVATLVQGPGEAICMAELHTVPAELSGHFLEGITYRFDLYPQSTPLTH
jgi:hypothetical protein